MKHYDFVGLAERFDESVVVLSMLLGVPLRDVLYLNSKRSGGYDGLCYKIQRANVTEVTERYLNSPEWKDYIAPELALYEAADASLDLTIDALGRERVQEQLNLFQKVLAAVEETCGPVTQYPCTKDGVPVPENETDCLVGDMGCGLDCIDLVADQYDLPK